MFELLTSLIDTKIYVIAGGVEFNGVLRGVTENIVTLFEEYEKNVIDIDITKIIAVKRKFEGEKIPNLRGWSFQK